MAKVLMVDDEVDLEPLILQKFRRKIRDGEYEFIFAHNGYEALDMIKKNPDIDMVVSDINMPEMDGLTLLDQLNRNSPHLKAVVVSAYGDMDNIRTAMNRGAFDFVTKPVNFDDLEITMNRTLEHLAMLRSALDARTKLISFNQELNIASKLQQAILPKIFPDVPSFQLYATMQPAAEVGGDFYDFFWLDDQRIGVVMADVSGKGITSGLFMAVSRTHLKAIAPYCYGPGEALTKLNIELSRDNNTAMFVTTFYGILDTKTGEFVYANGGHCPPVILDPKGDVRLLPMTAGMGLGVWEEAVFDEGNIKLEPGEALFLYTDGVTEAMSPSYEEFGTDRLLECLQQQQMMDSKALIENAVVKVKEFASTAPQSDDITCLALKYIGGQSL